MRQVVCCALLIPALAFSAGWAAEEMPLQLAVRSPEDLKFKAAAEKQYLIFNLLGSGKLAWDKGDFATAATKWESLLRVPGLPPEIDALVRPLSTTARQRAGAGGSQAWPVTPEPAPEPVAADQKKTAAPVSLTGTLSGGGTLGPGGAVVFLKRLDGPNPKPKEAKVRAVAQKDKRFIPRVLVITQGSTVDFKNEDPLFHNVFSLTRPNDFDLGLYKGGTTKMHAFNAPGAVQLLCNIHSSMIGWIYVVDTPWFGQADVGGRFTIKGVPPGEYLLSVWHEAASKLIEKKVRVTEGTEPLALVIDADKAAPAFVPDKSGKPRQPQLGY
jgi:plastocyanin